MHLFKCLLAAGAALVPAVAAEAAHSVVYAPSTSSFASAQAHQGPYVQGSTAYVTNMTVTTLAAGPGGSATHGTLSNVRSSVAAVQPGGSGNLSFGSNASASADLGLGRLRATVGAYGPNNFGSPLGFATARLSDTLYFTNTSGGDISLTFRYSFDGTIIDSNGDAGPSGQASLQFGCDGYRCVNSQGTGIRLGTSGDLASDNINAYFDESGIRQFARNIYGDQYEFPERFAYWQETPYGSGGVINGWMQSTLLIPTGETSLGIIGLLDLDCRGGSNCKFGNTGQFAFLGALPNGLTIGSASGVFLSQVSPPSGAVPEPASWALLILGFGTVGLAARRRRAVRLAS